jgi:uncharacterized protein DUF5995
MVNNAVFAAEADLSPAGRVRRMADLVQGYHSRYEAAHDERAIFAYVYGRITHHLADSIRDGGDTFDDPEWIAAVGVRFAERFVAAMDAIDAWLDSAPPGERPRANALYDTAPRPWADVYLAIHGGRSYVLEALVFSMMAHISHDLPLTLLDVGLETGGRSHVADYHRMNEVLAYQTETVQAMVAQRYYRLLASLDRYTGIYDEFFTNYGMFLSRSLAWYNACRLLDPSAAEEARQFTLGRTAAFIDAVRRPKRKSVRALVRILRFLIPPRRRWPQGVRG